LQALTLLNDPALYEIAEGLAARILAEQPAPAADLKRLEHAFILCLGRPASDREMKMLATVLEQEQAELRARARGPRTSEEISLKDHEKAIVSPWVSIARVLLNLDEFVTRE